MFAQYVHHRERDLVKKPGWSPGYFRLAARHPLFKLLLGAGMLAAFLLLPERPAAVFLGKAACLAAIFFFSNGISRRQVLLRGGAALLAFLTVFLFCSLLGDLFSGGDSRTFFLHMAAKSFWTLSISLLLFGSIGYPECVYLARLLRIPPFVSVQTLLIILIGGKIAREFSRVPAAWKSRGLNAAVFRRHPARAAGLLTVTLLRSAHQGGRLEQALISRGFAGRLYTCFSASWTRGDSAALLAAILVILLLFRVSAGGIF